ncbi:MAG: SGNH/GDSL hydrolase family protein [Acidimicrobiales bacterium]
MQRPPRPRAIGPDTTPDAARRLTPTRVAAWLHPGVRRVATTIPARQQAWAEHNARQADAAGPLWVSLGDSTVVGIGATHLERTAAAIVHRRLCEHTGEPWRLRNLGRYGAKLDAVVREQLPRLHEWGAPALVTVAAGSNDIVWSWGLRGFHDAMRELLDAVPVGTVVGTVPPGWWGKGLRANDWLRAEAAGRGLRVAEVGVLPQLRRMVAADGFHPNDAGYRFIADGVLGALGIPTTG